MALFPPWNPLQNINARVRPFQKVQAHHKNKPLSTEISWISLSTLKILRLFKSNSWFYFFSSHLFFYMKMSLPIFNLVGTDHLNAFQHNHWKEKSWSFFLNYNKKVFCRDVHHTFCIIPLLSFCCKILMRLKRLLLIITKMEWISVHHINKQTIANMNLKDFSIIIRLVLSFKWC